jgi:hypothetical protein
VSNDTGFADRSDKCRKAAFIDEYEALCKKYNLIVRSCECCGCWVSEPEDDGDDDYTFKNHIEHLKYMAR